MTHIPVYPEAYHILYIPLKGKPGADGEKGRPGSPGEQGFMGVPGPQGPKGIQGKSVRHLANINQIHASYTQTTNVYIP